jgi:hypothetical protein
MVPSTTKHLIAMAMLLGLLGCAGREFTRPDMATLRNGVTTYAQVIERFGPPYAEGSLVRNGKTIRTANYVHSAATGKPAREGIVATRAMAFYFYDNVLVGHEFLSSWAEDSTDFDEIERRRIIRGTTTEAEVVQLLGKPSGYQIYPMIESPSGKAAVYAYSELESTVLERKAYRKVLVVTFDAAGIVTALDFTSVGSK